MCRYVGLLATKNSIVIWFSVVSASGNWAIYTSKKDKVLPHPHLWWSQIHQIKSLRFIRCTRFKVWYWGSFSGIDVQTRCQTSWDFILKECKRYWLPLHLFILHYIFARLYQAACLSRIFLSKIKRVTQIHDIMLYDLFKTTILIKYIWNNVPTVF